LDPRDEAVRHGAGADQPDTAIVAAFELVPHQLGLVAIRVGNRREGGRGQNLADAAMDLVLVVELAPTAARAHVDHGHPVGAVEDHAARIAVDGGKIREPFHRAAEPVIVVLHDERVDLALLHRLAYRGPATRQLGIGDRCLQSLVHGRPCYAVTLSSATSAWIFKSCGMVSGARRPKPHSVARPNSSMTLRAAASRRREPSTPSVKWISPR